MQITTSPNIAVLDSEIIADLSSGQFTVNLSPSVWIGSGEDNVLGAKVKMVNPYGVTVRDYPTNYDTAPAFSGGIEANVSFAVPTQAGNYQYGKYIISVQLTDADGTNYVVTKTVSICAPNTLDKTKKYGSLSAKLSGVCIDGKVYVLVDNVPTYKGVIAESTTQNFTLDYPTGSGLSPLTTVQGSFSVQLFEGVYKIVGSVIATYNYGDNVFVKVLYNVDYSKPIICSLDDACVFTGLDALYAKLNSDCSDVEKKDTAARVERATLLLAAIDFGARSGDDVSSLIDDLEDVLGLTCSCNFDNGTPIINNNPSGDILIQGCNVEKEVVGLTTVYTIDNYRYVATVPDNGGVFTISTVVLNGCVQSQSYSFNIETAYSQIKGLANANIGEAQFWAGVIKKTLNSMDVSCLGITPTELNLLTLDALMQLMIDKACSGGNCSSTINTVTATQDGGDVIVSWTETGAYSADIYIDGLFTANVLNDLLSYRLVDYADGLTHTYRIISKCANGIYGSALQSTFGFTGCAAINTPQVSSTSISNATCPFDLTGLVYGLPTGIEAEWHTANNHLATSLLANPTAVSDGVYYVFATDGANCFSAVSVKVIVTCAVSSSCSAPQNLAVATIIGGLKITFQSALYPPPSNSYTIKRKLASDPDIDGSYVTIGAPTYNVSTGKWEITDTGSLSNTLYTYKAISNCTSSTPSVMVNYANINCPTLATTSDETSISYNFTDTGGDIDKYEVEIWDLSGVTLIHTDTYLSPSGTMNGEFDYLDSGIGYKIRIVPFIGTDSFPCPFITKYTQSGLSVIVSRSGSFSGTLSSFVSGGVPPYTYAWSYVATGGDCESATITSPTASVTAYNALAYASVSYQFFLTVTDSLSATADGSSTQTGTCLVPETEISLMDGSAKMLGNVEVGDVILDVDLNTGEKIETTVTSKTYHTVNKLYVINGGLLSTSEGHINNVRLTDGEIDLVQSMQLVEGDMLPNIQNGNVEVTAIEIKEGEFEVINISTTTKQYIANGIVTHNKLACPE